MFTEALFTKAKTWKEHKCSSIGGRMKNMWYILLFSRSVTSDSLQPHGLQQARLPCPSLSPRVCSNSRPLSLWCHPTISSSAPFFSSCLQSLPASGSFPMSWPKYRSFTFSTSPSNGHSGLISFRINWFDLLTVQGFSRVFSSTTVRKQLSLIHNKMSLSVSYHHHHHLQNRHLIFSGIEQGFSLCRICSDLCARRWCFSVLVSLSPAVLVNQFSKNKSPDLSVCWFPWYNYDSQPGWHQATSHLITICQLPEHLKSVPPTLDEPAPAHHCWWLRHAVAVRRLTTQAGGCIK